MTDATVREAVIIKGLRKTFDSDAAVDGADLNALLGFPAHYLTDFAILGFAVTIAVTIAASVLPRLVR